jgi:hypothetical protein
MSNWCTAKWSFVLKLGLLSILLPAPLESQSDRRSQFVYSLGLSSYDIPDLGRGSAFIVLAGRDWTINRYLAIGVALPTFFDWHSFELIPGQTVTETHMSILPEATFQYSPSQKTVRPFVGAGVGFAIQVGGRGPAGPTIHAVGGLQIDISSSWSMRTEGRLRSVDLQGHTLDLLIGLARFR